MKKLFLLAFLLSVSFTFGKTNEGNYIPNTLIYKVKPEYRTLCNANGINNPRFQELLKSLPASKTNKKFPLTLPPENIFNKDGERLADLSLIYEIKFTKDVSTLKVQQALLSTGLFEYVEPHFTHHVLSAPNDPGVGSQYYLNNIEAFAGWGIETGDTNIVIGITDTGCDMDHPDLVSKIKYTSGTDPVNGLDDDGDGYIDNYEGYDLGNGDNDPSVDPSIPSALEPLHGAIVAGIAAAETDNGIGMAGIGYNTKFLPIRISDSVGVITQGYEGIKYAADHGCSIINCSWGGIDYSLFGQDVVTYATINKNCVVVAAAGNNRDESVFYPASLNYVMSVASTKSTDEKRIDSNYGSNIDIAAPGDLIYSTAYNNGYATAYGGTSYAAPIVAGCAALVKAHFPTFTALQIQEQLRTTADNINGVTGNAAYADKLGGGRVNLFRALTESDPSIRITSKNLTDNNDTVFNTGDTISIRLILKNYLSATGNLNGRLRCTSSFVTLFDSLTNFGVMGSLASANNNADPFKIIIKNNPPENTTITLKVEFNDGSYTDFQSFDIQLNKDYINIEPNEIATTLTSKGRIGYNTQYGEGWGLAFKHKSSTLFEMGLVIGNDMIRVADCIRADYNNVEDNFVNLTSVRKIPSVSADFYSYSKFNDDSAYGNKLSLEIEQKTYAWEKAGNTKYIIIKYHIKNKSGLPLNSLYAGIFADWDIGDPYLDRTGYDSIARMGYSYQSSSFPYYGIKALSKGGAGCYSFDNQPGGAGGIDIYFDKTTPGDFSKAEKFQALSTNRFEAGFPYGNDISQLVHIGPLILAAGDTTTIAFALLAADDLTELKKVAASADSNYKSSPVSINNSDKQKDFTIFPNPATDQIFIEGDMKNIDLVEIFDLEGRSVTKMQIQKNLNKTILSVKDLDQGLYLVHVTGNGISFSKKIFVKGSNNQ